MRGSPISTLSEYPKSEKSITNRLKAELYTTKKNRKKINEMIL